MQPQPLDRKVWRDYYFEAEALALVVTVNEASEIFEVTYFKVLYDFRRGYIQGRQSFSGKHIILLDYQSLCRVYGQPKYNPLVQLQIKE